LENSLDALRKEARRIHSNVIERIPIPGWVRSASPSKCQKCGRRTSWVFYDNEGQGGPACHHACVESARSRFDKELQAYLIITGFNDEED
jgi:ferredoxin